MKRIFFAFLLSLIIIGCQPNNKSSIKLTEFVPKNTDIVLKINDFESFKNDVSHNSIWSNLESSSYGLSIEKHLTGLNKVKTNSEVLLCISSENDSLDFTIITKHHDSLIDFSAKNDLYSKIIDSIFIGTNSKVTLNTINRHVSDNFNLFERISSHSPTVSVYLKEKPLQLLNEAMFLETENKLASALVLDAGISQNDLALNGVAILSDSVQELLDVFKNTIPQENRTQFIAPSHSLGFKSFSFDNFEYFHSNLSVFQEQPIDSLVDIHWLETINEVGEIYFKNDTIVALSSIDGFSTKEALYEHQNVVATYREIDILEFNSPEQLHLVFRPLLAPHQFSYYTIIEDYILFANDETQLKDVISNFQNNTTIGNETAFKHTTEILSDESSLLFISKSNAYKSLIASLFNTSSNGTSLNDHAYAGSQFIQDNGYIYLNTSLRKNVSIAKRNTITEIFNTPLDSEVLMAPQLVFNHRTKQKEIVVQDVNNNLYLISNQGKILWKKQLGGNILGTIQQVDLYKNGRLQLAFATPKRVYILDRNGNDVSPFPMKFNDEITQPLSVFDYDNKRNYRFLVTQGSKLLMYNNKAKLVNGFDYNSNSNLISTTPKHFRIQNKDYIVFAAGDELMILNRKGDTRIKVNEPISFSGNEIHLYKNLFTTTSTNGELIQINTKGVVSKQNLLLNKNHQITASSKTLVSLSDNKLNIKHNNYELDFGHYSEPSIFYINDKIYVSVTDLQAHKIYLFDSNAKLQSNFPVYGNSKIYLDNVDSDSNLEFVTVGENNAIILYQKN